MGFWVKGVWGWPHVRTHATHGVFLLAVLGTFFGNTAPTFSAEPPRPVIEYLTQKWSGSEGFPQNPFKRAEDCKQAINPWILYFNAEIIQGRYPHGIELFTREIASPYRLRLVGGPGTERISVGLYEPLQIATVAILEILVKSEGKTTNQPKIPLFERAFWYELLVEIVGTAYAKRHPMIQNELERILNQWCPIEDQFTEIATQPDLEAWFVGRLMESNPPKVATELGLLTLTLARPEWRHSVPIARFKSKVNELLRYGQGQETRPQWLNQTFKPCWLKVQN